MKLYTATIHGVCFRINKSKIESIVDENVEKVYQGFRRFIESAKEEGSLELSQLEDDFIRDTFRYNLVIAIMNFVDSYDDNWLDDSKHLIDEIAKEVISKLNYLNSEVLDYNIIDFVTLEDKPIANNEFNDILIEYENAFEEDNKEFISEKIVDRFNEDDHAMIIKGVRIPIRLNKEFFEQSLEFEITASFYDHKKC